MNNLTGINLSGTAPTTIPAHTQQPAQQDKGEKAIIDSTDVYQAADQLKGLGDQEMQRGNQLYLRSFAGCKR